MEWTWYRIEFKADSIIEDRSEPENQKKKKWNNPLTRN